MIFEELDEFKKDFEGDLGKGCGPCEFLWTLPRFVFYIKGNNYRLIAIVLFKMKTVYIRYIGTHRDYERVDVANI